MYALDKHSPYDCYHAQKVDFFCCTGTDDFAGEDDDIEDNDPLVSIFYFSSSASCGDMSRQSWVLTHACPGHVIFAMDEGSCVTRTRTCTVRIKRQNRKTMETRAWEERRSPAAAERRSQTSASLTALLYAIGSWARTSACGWVRIKSQLLRVDQTGRGAVGPWESWPRHFAGGNNDSAVDALKAQGLDRPRGSTPGVRAFCSPVRMSTIFFSISFPVGPSGLQGEAAPGQEVRSCVSSAPSLALIAAWSIFCRSLNVFCDRSPPDTCRDARNGSHIHPPGVGRGGLMLGFLAAWVLCVGPSSWHTRCAVGTRRIMAA